ncbi:MAG TPA: hypothetical protein VE596_00045 [Gaiellaceae bacterium]|nr:hypothetical protein [Gaiellaceae bacterium]
MTASDYPGARRRTSRSGSAHRRILHATGRDGVARVVEELEPDELRAMRRRLVRLAP